MGLRMLGGAVADILRQVSEAVGGPYHRGLLRWDGQATYDAGGSIATPGTPSSYGCMVQVDAATEAMRGQDGFQDGDVRLLILDGCKRPDTNVTVQVLEGPHANTAWMVASTLRDPLGAYWECRGRAA